MSDEELYLQATNEVEGEDRSLSLWAKVMALSEGDEAKAKYKYIRLRVEQLADEKLNKLSGFTRKTVDEFDLNYMPITEFSKIKAIPEDKVINMIRDGFYVGQIKNGVWYVSRKEAYGENQAANPAKKIHQKINAKNNDYIPVEEFAEFKGIKSEKAIEMIRNGFYQGRIIDKKWYVSYSEVGDKRASGCDEELSFLWWQVWAWLGLTLFNLLTLLKSHELPELGMFLVIVNSILMIMVLKFNKYAFLISTIIYLNPVLWIINGVYLKNRWNHPKVNIQINNQNPTL